jgi:UDP-N-acetylmuramyl pentapeptide phosphotransferase/UDP-N-acetylglucosamine-1-phosphate transferase
MISIAALLAALVATVLSGLIAWAGPVDAPGERRSHEKPTPTSGGVAIVAATCLGLAVLAASTAGWRDPRFGWLALLAAGTGLFGALDDMLDLPARTKLLIQLVPALLFAALVAHVGSLPLAPGLILPLGLILGGAGTALWIIVLVNGVNFMDGADGLMPGAMIISLIGLAAAAALHGQTILALVAVIGAAAGLGFLPWNFPAHRLFQGDAGALFSGFFVAGLAVLATSPLRGEALSPYAAVFGALPILTDVLLTLLVRARAGRMLFSPHREHLYQRWLDASGGSHPALAWRFWAISAVFTAAGVAAEQAPMGWRPVIFAGGLAAAVAGWTALRLGRRPS